MIEFIQNLSETYKSDLKLGEGEELPSVEMPDEWSWSYEETNTPEEVEQ